MATRSNIAIFNTDTNEVRSVYCHWDGYPSYNGRVLRDHYTTTEAVNELIDGGDIVALGETAQETEFYNMPSVTDIEFESLDEAVRVLREEDYLYIFLTDSQKWFCYDSCNCELGLYVENLDVY